MALQITVKIISANEVIFISYDKEFRMRPALEREAKESGEPLVTFRIPRAEDGPNVTALIRNCPPLDTNSAYCNLLQCTHFADTCVIAERDGTIAGWISAYRPPADPDRMFVWQVAVDASTRGLGLGCRMLDELIARPAARGVTALLTTITEPNEASWKMFRSFAHRCGARVDKHPLFERERHFRGAHDTEFLVSIGPFARQPHP